MPKLFVIMPFGLKRHEGVEYDFDAVYQTVIRPIAERVGWDVLRIDEISAPGVITDQYLNELMTADLVLADISIPNANVYYELGIRHSVSSSGTLLISSSTPEDVPFDLRGQRVIFFVKSKTDSLQQGLSSALQEFRAGSVTSPLRALFERTGVVADPKRDLGEFELDVAARITRAKNPDQLIALWKWLEPLSPLPILQLRDLAERLSDCGEWVYAAEVLRAATRLRAQDFEIQRRLGWFLQQAGPEYDSEALAAYDRALSINPNDPETLGLIGGREKRKRNFEAAISYYTRGAALSPNNLYMLVNEAAMTILVNPATPAAGISLYESLRSRIEQMDHPDDWSELLRGESYFVTGDFTAAELAYRRAAELTGSPKPLRSGADQLEIFASVSFQATQAIRLAELLREMAKIMEASSHGKPVKLAAGASVSSEEHNALPVLIHLSDLHFGSKVAGGKSLHRFFEGENAEPLSQHLCQEFDRLNGHFKVDPDRLYLVVSGDLAYRAVNQEFSEAKECLDSICHGLAIPKERVVIIPGNHDVNWIISG